jgi:hypothetical protein
MKITKTILTLFVLLSLASCKKDNTPPSILGKWNLIKSYNKEIPTQGIQTFRTGSYILFSKEQMNLYVAIEQEPFETDSIGYTRTANKIKFNDPTADIYLKIAELTSNKLILEEYDNIDDTYYGSTELNR